MKVTLVPGRELGPDLVAAWIGLQEANTDLISPYFHPEFTKIVAAVRNDIEVAVVESDGQIVALFPFQREQASHARPVGGVISDYHGLICRRDTRFSSTELLRQCRLDSWDFDHLVAAQSDFAPFHWSVDVSPQIDVSKGYEAYVRERRAAGSEQIKKAYNLMRRLEREVGSLRFVAESTDGAILATVLTWKSEQYRKSDKPDLFTPGWIRAAASRICETRVDGFSGALSLLYAGDRLVAGHLGMRSLRAWHYWFPSYDPEAARYSPGMLLLLKMAEHAASVGTPIIDLGRGMSSYKERLMNSSSLLASGRLERPSWRSSLGRSSRALRSRLRESPLGRRAHSVVEWLRGQRNGGGSAQRTAPAPYRRQPAKRNASCFSGD
jgi:CelD/BcsL family acetyltransferase involved in cellulose biosynthesis